MPLAGDLNIMGIIVNRILRV